ncbi:DUF4132 domain-containing protein [Neorhizobium sp. JUb45]|uniref:DUF4132 domain-containing protein n=1 Tax=Neorhizobium sp. JUb45 TaxID=2485113 RepID=UPI00104C4FF8|nr:DUF4132 domain-containing protein [Neorhizobium sp. JUb45]TCQ99311.1 HEAT repeat protein [Neorhizobium sp. JUb45]
MKFVEGLKKIMGGGRSETAAIMSAESGLTVNDRQAIIEDFAAFEEVEKGLGAALARYVVAGTDEAMVLHVVNLMNSGKDDVVSKLHATFNGYDHRDDRKAENQRRREARQAVLVRPEGFDAAAMLRYMTVHGKYQGQHRWSRLPGSDSAPFWLRTAVQMIDNNVYHKDGGSAFLTAQRAFDMMTAAGIQPSVGTLIDCAFMDKETTYGQSTQRMLGLPGLDEAMLAMPADAIAMIGTLTAGAREIMVRFVGQAGLVDHDLQFFDFAFAMASDGSKAVREAAAIALKSGETAKVQARAEELLASRKAGERLAGVNILAALLREKALPVLDKHEAGEKSSAVLAAIATTRATYAAAGGQSAASDDGRVDGPDGYVAFDGRFVPVPAFSMDEDALPEDLEAAFRDVLTKANAEARVDYDRTPPGKDWNQRPAKPFVAPFDPAVAKNIVAAMRGDTLDQAKTRAVWEAIDANSPDHWMRQTRKAMEAGFKTIFARSDVPFPALARLLFCASDGRSWVHILRVLLGGSEYWLRGPDKEIMARLKAGTDIRVLAQVADQAGVPDVSRNLNAVAERTYINLGEMIDEPVPSTLWMLLADDFAALDAALAGDGMQERWTEDFVYSWLRTFPHLPRRYFPLVADRALQAGVRQRDFSRYLLREVADLTPLIVPMLTSGPETKRLAAARWLAERRDASAIAPLREALKKEKSVAVRAAAMTALAACGDDTSDFFSKKTLLAEAEKGLASTKADYSALFDAENLPVLHWADGREVSPILVRWWFARSHKLKLPGGDPMIHMALERLDRKDAEKLGAAIFSAFISCDTQRPTSEEANAYASAGAKQRYNYTKQWRKDFTEELAFAELRREKLAIYLNSALDHRGLLALARYAPPAETTILVKRFLKDHGKRPNQCRALLDALMANPVPQVLQLMLTASQRHKQPGLRKYAGEVVTAFAESRGWTPAELGDRTIPSAGIDEDGILELPIGERTYRARLTVERAKNGKEEMKLALENPDGKTIASLPSPTDPQEAEEAKDAKKLLSSAKKELKQTAELQAGRLYEAMCAARIWPREDFEAFLLNQPIVGRLLRRLVLSGSDEQGKLVTSFRALDDGSFTDANDDPVDITSFAGIAIAHRVKLGEEAAKAWLTHIEDYEVKPLFEQLDRPVLADGKPDATVIDDRRGWMIDNLTLRSAAEGLGYIRGPVEDGAGFYTYEKSFADCGFAAVIEFTGSYIGENDRVLKALQDMRFARILPGGRVVYGGETTLSKVPEVLLSETWNDLRAIADKGTGFDAEWEKKASW